MDFAINLIQKIPAGWPRLATLAAIVMAYFFFPNIVKKVSGGQKEKEMLERMTRFLQVKKLLLELEVLQKEKNLSGFTFPGEARLLAELKEAAVEVAKSNEKISYVSRLKYSLLGAAVFFSSRRCFSSSASARKRTGFKRQPSFFSAVWPFRQRVGYWLPSSLWEPCVPVFSTA